jgi:curved DNA-binding protein CbpA
MTEVKDNKIAEACSILFGNTFTVEKTTIDYIQLSGIKHAFREKVKEYHPDAVRNPAPDSNDNFIKLKDAYDFLISVKSDKRPGPAISVKRSSATAIPKRRLRLGEYLYYSGKISWQELISAITWQRKNNTMKKKSFFGMYFIKFGILTSSELGFSLFKLNIHNSNY